MYAHLVMTHSWLRYIVLILMIWSLIKAYQGKNGGVPFDNKLRLFTIIGLHLQLVLGLVICAVHPDMKSLMQGFMGQVHILGMIIAVVILTIGSAKAKRKETDAEKWQTIWTWYLIGLALILVMIPWPFSPLAQAPWIRGL